MQLHHIWPSHHILFHDDVIKGKHFLRYRPCVQGIHRSPVNSPHKGQWRGALIFSLICAWINGSVNNREAGDLRRHRAHYDVIVMSKKPRCFHARPIVCFVHVAIDACIACHRSLYSMMVWYQAYTKLFICVSVESCRLSRADNPCAFGFDNDSIYTFPSIIWNEIDIYSDVLRLY